jgi:hypothetical protein
MFRGVEAEMKSEIVKLYLPAIDTNSEKKI